MLHDPAGETETLPTFTRKEWWMSRGIRAPSSATTQHKVGEWVLLGNSFLGPLARGKKLGFIFWFYFQASAVLCLRCIRGNKKTSGNHHHCSSGTIFLGSPTDNLPSFHLSETFYGFLVYYVQDIFIVRENNCKKWDDSTLARNRSLFEFYQCQT